MNNLLFHQVESEANKASFTEFDNVDFLINVGQGRALLKNSLRILGDLKVNSTGDTRAVGQIFHNANVGAHAYIDSIQIQFTEGQNQGQIENIQNYGRYVNMLVSGSNTTDDLLSGNNLCELKAPNNLVVEEFCNGKKTKNSGAKITESMDFSIKPVCCLNRMNNDLSYNRSGTIKLTLNMAKQLSALKGTLQTINTNYAISNLRISYMSVPDTNQDVVMRLLYNYKGAVLSNFSNISAKVPAVCEGVSISFQEQRRENVVEEDNYELRRPNHIQEIQYLFNDSTNEYIQYKIDDIGEMLERGVASMSKAGHNQFQGSKLQASNFVLGLDFENLVDLSTNKFNLQMKSDVDGQNPMNVYFYFHSRVQI